MVKLVFFNISGACNLACPYCFANHGPYKDEGGLMTPETAQKAVEWLFKWMGKTKSLQIGFFGGEPLLNWKIVEFTVDYAKKLAAKKRKKVSFKITTNGTLLNQDNIRFMRKHRFGFLISIDSHRQKVNDALRPSLDKSSAFKKVIKALSFFRTGDHVGIRASITRSNLDIKGYIQYFSNYKAIKFMWLVPTWSTMPGYSPDQKVIGLYKKAMEEYLDHLFRNWEKGNIIFPHTLSEHIYKRRNLNRIKHPYFCGAGKDVVSISPKGRIFLCPQFIGEEYFLLGDVEKGMDHSARRHLLREIALSKKKKCRNCYAKMVCGGGCHAINYASTGKVGIPDKERCELERFYLECAGRIINKVDDLLKA